jgi:hypothetical protein
MRNRRILRISGGAAVVAREEPFESEARLHRAIADHPEVLPSEELGLGTLIPLASELNLGTGPMDLLAVDASGRLAIVEFKRGTENPDVRKVVAQLLDYGSSLWRTDVDRLEEACRDQGAVGEGGLVAHAADRFSDLGVDFAEDAFRAGMEATLEAGDIVFLYVARDLDERTRRIMTYLGEGPRLSVFAVEVDNFHIDHDERVLVPRVAFVPSWVVDHGASRVRPTRLRLRELLEAADDDVREVAERLRSLAQETGAVVVEAERSLNIRPSPPQLGIALYPADGWRSVTVWLKSFRRRGDDEVADRFRAVIADLYPDRTPAQDDPMLPVHVVHANWARARDELFRPYLEARRRHVEDDPETEE